MIACPGCATTARATAKYCQTCGASLTATGNLTGILAGKYLITGVLGQGGMGAVYKALDSTINRVVAIKEMSQSTLVGLEYQKAVTAFKNEARLLGNLRHPMLPAIYENFTENGRWYLAMEYIEGKTLEDVMHTPDLAALLRYGPQLCDVLTFLHTQNITFRDIKPANIMITPEDEVRLIDFGIARFFAANTKDTSALGSPGYAAPEQYKKGSEPKSDVYALGALFHFLLSGTDPSDAPFQFVSLPKVTHPALLRLNRLVEEMITLDKANRPDSFAVQARLLSIRDDYRSNPMIVAPKADATVFLISSMLDGKTEKDKMLLERLEKSIVLVGKMRGKTIACEYIAPTVKEVERIMRESGIILVVCTPAILTNEYASEAVNTAIEYRTNHRDEVLVVPIYGKQCEWGKNYLYLKNYAGGPRDRKPIVRSSGYSDEALNEIGLTVYQVLEEKF